MRQTAPPCAVAALLAVAACTQSDQNLPFSPDPDFVARRVIGPQGGIVSHPYGISIEFPTGAVPDPTTVSIAVGVTDFPSAVEGQVLPGTYFEVSPAGLALSKDAFVDIAVPEAGLDPEQRLRIGLATPSADAGIETDGVAFDVTSSILRAGLGSLGSVAAVIADNAVLVTPQNPPVLAGGFKSIFGAQPAAPVAAAALAAADPVAFDVRCSYTGAPPRCVSTGTIELWASEEIQERLSGQLVLLNPNVDGHLEFTDFVDGLPTRATGQLAATGTLRVQLGQAVTSYYVDDTFLTTGPGGYTDLVFDGSTIRFVSTSVGPRSTEYQIEQVAGVLELTLRGHKTVEFENEDGSITSATLYIDLLLTG